VRLVALVLALLAGGCGSDLPAREVLNVYAASSLTDVFGDLERGFELARPDIDVRLTLAGSQVLRLQIEQGAPADVFASADPEHMQALVEEGQAHGVRTFATNELVVIVPFANPAGIESFEQLTRARRVVIGTENVPVGRYAREALALASRQLGGDFGGRVLSRVVSEESNVRLARAKVELGEADAAIVYRTDAMSSDRILVVTIPAAMNVRASYVIGVVGSASESARAAELWVDWVLSEEARVVLRSRGFSVDADPVG
jgi:molybdate transport system substrate-binding protein